jgi:hypothetical protein
MTKDKYNRCDDCGRAIKIGSVVPGDWRGNCPAGGTHHGLEKELDPMPKERKTVEVDVFWDKFVYELEPYSVPSSVMNRLYTHTREAFETEREYQREDIKLLKNIHKLELDAISLKSLEDFMLWADNRKKFNIDVK